MATFGATLRVLRPASNVLAFYDGRIEGVRLWSEAPNWLDDGAFGLGCCSYAILDGGEALVYDTHMSLDHAAIVRRTLVEAGATSIRVVLSHWHCDHVAGNAVFGDCEIIANRLTADLLVANRATLEGEDPPIRPLVMPNRLFDEALDLTVGSVAVALRRADIHSQDGTVLLLPQAGLMLAGDTLEDTVTYVAEPGRLADHLVDLGRMAGWNYARILPNHGAPDVIESGGYGPALIGATQYYVEHLLRCRAEPDLARLDLEHFMAEPLASGAARYYAAYEAVHRRNVAAVLAL